MSTEPTQISEEGLAELTGARVDMKQGAPAGVESRELRVLLRPKETAAIATVSQT